MYFIYQFRTCLGTLNLKFSKEEIDALIEKYKIGNSGLINYAQLCDNINFVFSDAADPVGLIENSKSTASFSDADKETFMALIGAIKNEIVHKRILIKPQFQDYDRTNSCHVTGEQFRRVLKELKLIPPTEDLYQLLLRKYFDKGNIREVNYFKFCADIDRPQDIFPEYVAKNPKPELVIYHGQLRDAGSSFYGAKTDTLDVINNRFQQ